MRLKFLYFAVFSCFAAISPAQETGETSSQTESLKDSIREWIETMREIQKEEDAWERDRELLEGQRTSLESEIAGLKEQIARAKVEKEGADAGSLEKEEKREAYLKSKEVLATEVRALEEALMARIPVLPGPMTDEARVAQLVAEIKSDVQLSGDEKDSKISKRLTNVLNLLAETEKWQQTTHLRDELHQTSDGREFNMKVVYFGLASAYAVNETGDLALVGAPGVTGWKFEERNELAPQVLEMVKVINGDADAKFISLPIDLP